MYQDAKNIKFTWILGWLGSSRDCTACHTCVSKRSINMKYVRPFSNKQWLIESRIDENELIKYCWNIFFLIRVSLSHKPPNVFVLHLPNLNVIWFLFLWRGANANTRWGEGQYDYGFWNSHHSWAWNTRRGQGQYDFDDGDFGFWKSHHSRAMATVPRGPTLIHHFLNNWQIN